MNNSNKKSSALTIVLAHPSQLFTEGLASLLSHTQYNITYQSAGIDYASSLGCEPEGKVIFIVGGRTASEIVETVRSIRGELPTAYILVINASTGQNDVLIALEAGADGYLRDAISSQTLIRVIELILENETILPPEFVKSLREPRPMPVAVRSSDHGNHDVENRHEGVSSVNGEAYAKVKLSAREGSILKGLVDGAPNKVIAQRLQITEATVKVHVKAILRKIRVKNRTQAAIWAAHHMPASEEFSADRDSPLYAQLR